MSNLTKIIQLIANSKVTSWFLLAGFFFIIAAASHSGFMIKHGLRDGDVRNSAIKMMDGKANRPFVYRQLVPIIANSVQDFIDHTDMAFLSKLKIKLNATNDQNKYYANALSAKTKGYEYGYCVIYFTNFLALLATLFMLRALLIRFNFSQCESILAPSAFIIAFPYLQTVGGYFYDSVELAFFSGALLLAFQGRLLVLVLLTILATFNKESFLFFIPTLYPILREKYTIKKTLLFSGIAMLIAGLIKLYLKVKYELNTGGEFEFYLFKNIKNYLTPSTYFELEPTYGLLGPGGFSVIFVAITAIIVIRAIDYVPLIWKKHMQIAMIINIPLFLAFCWVGELRNLSMLYVGFVFFIAAAFKSSHL